MRTALVTGGTGFIGHNLANALAARGLKVTVMDKASGYARDLDPKIGLILSDIRHTDFPKHFDIIYHLAALRSLPDSFLYPEEYISTNVWGTYNLLKAYPESRFVFASSSAAAENKSVYGITKRSAEHFVNMHKNAVSIRFMNVFGEGQLDLGMAVPAFCHAIKHGKTATINGNGSLERDYTYVHDLVDEIIRIGDSKIKGQTEIGYGAPITIIDLYKLLVRISRKKENYVLGPSRKGDMKKTCSKYKIKEPKFGFMEGMRRTFKWYLAERSF